VGERVKYQDDARRAIITVSLGRGEVDHQDDAPRVIVTLSPGGGEGRGEEAADLSR
jgi:hypothetical protein